MAKKATNSRWTATNSEGYASPVGLAVDVVVLTVRDGKLLTLVVERPEGESALPGGFVGETEAAEDTAARKLKEKTGLRDLYLEQLAAFTDPKRDARGWIPTVAYVALVPADTEPDDPAARWVPARKAGQLAFDHNEILQLALDRVAGKLWWSNVAVGILPGGFAISEARQVYEAIAGTSYDPSTFARDLRATGLITETNGMSKPSRGRPAKLYGYVTQQPSWGAGRRKRISSASTSKR